MENLRTLIILVFIFNNIDNIKTYENKLLYDEVFSITGYEYMNQAQNTKQENHSNENIVTVKNYILSQGNNQNLKSTINHYNGESNVMKINYNKKTNSVLNKAQSSQSSINNDYNQDSRSNNQYNNQISEFDYNTQTPDRISSQTNQFHTNNDDASTKYDPNLFQWTNYTNNSSRYNHIYDRFVSSLNKASSSEESETINGFYGTYRVKKRAQTSYISQNQRNYDLSTTQRNYDQSTTNYAQSTTTNPNYIYPITQNYVNANNYSPPLYSHIIQDNYNGYLYKNDNYNDNTLYSQYKDSIGNQTQTDFSTTTEENDSTDTIVLVCFLCRGSKCPIGKVQKGKFCVSNKKQH